MNHKSVLLDEVSKIISFENDKKYLDCTFGAGGHSKTILQSTQNSTLLALDIDPTTLKFANIIKNQYGTRFNFKINNFSEIDKVAKGEKFDGIILDLGVSSMQIDTAERGFSFNKDGDLDMRMGNSKLTAYNVINNFNKEDLANIIYNLGEEVQSKSIAQAIVTARKISPINSTLELTNIVKSAMHYRPSKINPVTKTFQAIRIYVNQELINLRNFLSKVKNFLNIDAIILIISFHSLEDQIVKNFFKKYEIKKNDIKKENFLKIITKKPITPSKLEIKYNKRARSAKLRAAKRLL